MKKNFLALTIALIFGFTASATEPVNGEKKVVKTEESTVTWKGYKVAGSHSGTVAIKEGSLIFDGDKLTGGDFIIDMPTLVTTDDLGDMKGKLEGHLKSDDFFGVATHPTASLVFTKVESSGKNSYEVIGDLTIKGITKAVTFDVSIYGSKATATMKVDRTDYDVKYGSTLFGAAVDKAIYDEFDLVVDLVF